VYATAVGNVFVDAHGQRAGALGHEPYEAAYLRNLCDTGPHDVVVAQHHHAFQLHALDGVHQAVEGAQQGGLAASRGADDARNLVLRNLHVHQFQYRVAADVHAQGMGAQAQVVGMGEFPVDDEGRGLVGLRISVEGIYRHKSVC